MSVCIQVDKVFLKQDLDLPMMHINEPQACLINRNVYIVLSAAHILPHGIL